MVEIGGEPLPLPGQRCVEHRLAVGHYPGIEHLGHRPPEHRASRLLEEVGQRLVDEAIGQLGIDERQRHRQRIGDAEHLREVEPRAAAVIGIRRIIARPLAHYAVDFAPLSALRQERHAGIAVP